MSGKNIIGYFILLVLIESCGAVWVPDPIDPRLPKYTEKGYNTAGAIINGELWKSKAELGFSGSFDEPSVLFFPNRDSLIINFLGEMDSSNYSRVAFSFLLRNTQVNEWSDLIKLNGKKFTIDGVVNKAWVISNGSYYLPNCATSAFGQLYLRYVALDTSNANQTDLIMSGTFSLTQNDNVCGQYQVTYGRFDYRF
jgi:hypothetical protein